MASFDRLFATLIVRWKRYQDAPRDPNDLAELCRSRRELDVARAAIAEARDQLIGAIGPHPIGRAPHRIAVDPDLYQRLRVQGTFPEG